MRIAEGYEKSPYRSERQRRHLLGYTDPLVVHPGDEVRVMVSSEFESYESQVVRLIHGDTSPESPGFKAERVATSADGTHPGRIQDTHAGSYVEVPDAPEVSGSFTVAAWIWPTVPEAGVQTIVAHRSRSTGYSLGFGVPRGMPTGPDVDSAGCTIPPDGTDDGLTLRVGSAEFSLGAWPDRQALALRGGFLGRRRRARRACSRGSTSGARSPRSLPQRESRAAGRPATPTPTAGEPGTPLLLAAGSRIDGTEVGAYHCFNGKIERPCLFSRALSVDELEALAAGADPLDDPRCGGGVGLRRH